MQSFLEQVAKTPINFVIPNDKTLFAYEDPNTGEEQDLSQAFTQAWKRTGKIALEQYLSNIVTNGDLSQLPQDKKELITQAFAKNAGENERLALSSYLEDLGQLVFDERERLKTTSKSPQDILQKSFAILSQHGFSQEKTKQIANGAGNNTYLRAYMQISAENVVVSEQGKKILQEADKLRAQGNNVQLIRCDHKREEHPEGGLVMQPETDMIQALYPSLNIVHSGMKPDGTDYIKDLPIDKNNKTVIVLTQDPSRNDAITFYRVSSPNEKSKLTKPLAEAAAQRNVTIVAIDSTRDAFQKRIPTTINVGEPNKSEQGYRVVQEVVGVPTYQTPINQFYASRISEITAPAQQRYQ